MATREFADQTKNVDELYVRHERAERLRRAICRLKPSLRNVVEIHQSNDSSVKEIAELAGLSVAATKSRLLRARAALRRDLVERPEKQCRSSQKVLMSVLFVSAVHNGRAEELTSNQKQSRVDFVF